MRIRNHPLELRISEIFKQECIAIILTTIIVLSSPEYAASALDHDSNSNTTVANQKNESSIFIQHILDIYGSNSTITIDNLQNLISTIQNFNKKDEHIDDIDTKLHEQHSIDLDRNKNIDSMCENSTSVLNNHNHCLTTKCLSAEEILQIHSISSNHELSHSDFGNLSATVLYQLQNPACYSAEINTHRKVSPSAAEVWGYGFICVTLINLCSLMGLFFLPLMQKSYYNRILMFMVALAVGTLVGSSLLFLIPNALSLVDEASPLGGLYLWRCTVIMAGIYMFFLTERIIKLITEYKVSRAAMKEIDKNVGRSLCSVKIHEQHTDSQMGHVSFTPAHMNTEENQLNGKCTGDRAADNHTLLQQHNNDLSPDKLSVEIANGIQKSNGHSHGATHVVNGRSKIKPVAWMVIFGDGLHNFIDGLSIGAAFADNTWAGISISLAVICEELPHELGDFAILLNSGMSMRKALGYNFLSACMCYLGTAVGIMVGELTAGSEWIFAIAGGMFLYIALVDMFPEVNAAAEEEVASMPYSLSHSLKIFALQNAGLIVGFGIMIILAKFGEDISFVE